MKVFKFSLSLLLTLSAIESFGQLKPAPVIKPKTLDIQYLQKLPVFTKQISDTSSTFTMMASGTRSYATGHAFVQINGASSAHLTQLDYKDTLIGSTVKHFTTIVSRMSAHSFLDAIAKNLNKCKLAPEDYTMTTILTNFSYENIEQRDYSECTTNEISLPALNRSDRTPFEVKINIASNNVQTENNTGNRINSLLPKSKPAFCSNFKFSLGNLPAQRILSVSSINIEKTRAANGRRDSISISDFTIEIPVADSGPWNDWFESPNRATDLREGEITILGTDLKEILMTIRLMNVEIISYSASAGATASTKRIGLRAKDIDIQMKTK
ncbi:MAG: hypothetical protein IPP86_04460 [Bacteroidetes bacterium]|nr:hypothetical protein [Bacteroidota bacterium]